MAVTSANAGRGSQESIVTALSKSVILTKIRVATMQPVLTWVQTISANVHRVSKEDIVRLTSMNVMPWRVPTKLLASTLSEVTCASVDLDLKERRAVQISTNVSRQTAILVKMGELVRTLMAAFGVHVPVGLLENVANAIVMNVLIGHVKMVESVSIPEEAMSALAQKLIRESIASEM